MYHLTDFKKYERCPKLFWLSRRERKPFTAFVKYPVSFMSLCKSFLMITDAFVGEVNDETHKALEALSTHQWLINARFAYEDLRVKVPIMLQEDGKRILYFPYALCYPKEGEAQKIADTLQVLTGLDIIVDEVYIIHLRADYVRGTTLEVRDLLQIQDHLYNGKNRPNKTIKELVDASMRELSPLLEELRACDANASLDMERSNACTRGIKCSFFDDCFPEELSSTDIYHLVQSSKKYDMKANGIHDIADVSLDQIEGTRHQYAQIMAAKYGQYVDQAALRCWLKEHIHYPISYLDFEWETYAIPPYQGMKPFDVLCFQYSLHIEQKDGTLSHQGYIGIDDCREAFIQQLLHDIPSQGVILVYNMEGAEKLRLVQLAEQYPQYEEQLENVWERMVDLSLPFSTGNVYDNRMEGYFSLKTLVKVFSDYDYQDLDISYGLDAVASYRSLATASEEEAKDIRQKLDAYCSMDTYAEYIVYHALQKLAKQAC